MKKLFLLLSLIVLGFSVNSQNTSPLKLVNFHKLPNEIVDLTELKNRAGRDSDFDGNKAALIRVKAQGFSEKTMIDFTVSPRPGIEIIDKIYRDGEMWLYVSSNCQRAILIKYMGEFEFALPSKLEAKGVYELILGMETATLMIRVVPAEADIYIDGQKAGTGYASKAVSIGTEHRWKVESEYYWPKEGVEFFNKREEKSINVNLEPNFGYITIKSEPSGADVYIDKNKVGTTPYMMEKISLGKHVVELRLSGYENYGDMVTVNADELNRQMENVKLMAVKIVYGTLNVSSSPAGADISVDGEYKGQTPQTFDIPIGTHDVTLTKQGCTSANKTVTVNEGQTTEVNLYLQTGREITISTDGTGDKIYVDGNYVGESPMTTGLSFGEHEVKAVRGDKESKQTVTVAQNGGDTNVKLQFELKNKTFTVNGVTFEMVAVKGGTFTMGCTSEQGGDCESDESPAHSVTLSDYYIGKFEVTQKLWEAVMGTTVRQQRDKADPSWPMRGEGDNYPMYYVSWNDCKEFIGRLNQLTGANFRLPTEAEWEYAARGGNKNRGYKYSGSNSIADVSWYNDNSGSKTHAVGAKSPNELGIYDMSGNVYEWCEDWYGDYSGGSQTDPKGPSSGSSRVSRGGSWYYIARSCRVSYRDSFSPVNRYIDLGFRVVLIP